nr:lipoprotein [Synechocystis sp. FACHB-383]
MGFGVKSWILFSVLVLALAGCGQRGGLPCVETEQLGDRRTEQQEAPGPFENLNVLVGVDASESMVGFVSQPGSRYGQAIASLHTLLQNKNLPTSYWRVGSNDTINQAQSISAAQFLAASKAPFYCRRDQPTADYPCVSSTLGQLYELATETTNGANPAPENDNGEEGSDNPTAPRSLKILLTDLEPDDAAVGQISGLISKELKENPNYKAVLLGVRSQFRGNVYSANASYPTFVYNTAGQDVDQKGRPFFILMTGPQDTVDELVKEFRRLPLDVNKAFRASAFELGQADTVTLDNSSFNDEIQECVIEIGSVDRQRPNQDQERDWLMVEQTNCGENSSPPLPPLELNIPSKSTVSLTGGELTPDLFNVSEPFVSVKKAEIVQNPGAEDARLLLTAVFDGNKLPQGQGKLVYITLGDRQLDQAVWQDWDMDIGNPNGAKTQNLLLFVSGLRGAVANDQDAVKFCLGYSHY